MLDMRLFREDVEKLRQGLRKRPHYQIDLDGLLKLDAEKREITFKLDGLKAERNAASEAIARMKKEGRDAAAEIEKTRSLGDAIKEGQERFNAVEAEFKAGALLIPNLPHESVPEGQGSKDNVVVSSWGEKPSFAFTPRHHLDLGKGLNLFDFERGAKIAGRGFPVYTGLGARFERALLNFFLDTHTRENGFTEVSPPYLVNRAAMTGTGQLPKMEEDMYLAGADDLFLIPTAEVPVTNLHAEEILPAADLPISYCAYSACFRREAGSWGKDTRGFLRLHQFNKVEMVKFTESSKSYAALEELRGYGEGLLRKLGLHYRVLELCTGDLSFGAAKCYDLEVFAPAEGMWLEVSSVSNFEDFQARRANIRTKVEGKTQFVHTLNGSGLATPRILVALLETYQREDGTVTVPEALRPYLGGLEVLS